MLINISRDLAVETKSIVSIHFDTLIREIGISLSNQAAWVINNQNIRSFNRLVRKVITAQEQE